MVFKASHKTVILPPLASLAFGGSEAKNLRTEILGLRLRMTKFLLSVLGFIILKLTLLFFLTVISPNGYSFSAPFLSSRDKAKKTSELPKASAIWTTQTEDYLIFFSLFEGSKEQMKGDNALKMRELNYKWVSWDENPKRFFEGGKWAEIRFLDAEGFILARDKFRLSDLTPQNEWYGTAFIEAKKTSKLDRAEVVWRTGAIPEDLKQNEQTTQTASLSANAPDKKNDKPSVETSLNPKMDTKAEKISKKKEMPEPPRITNEDIQKVLEAVEKQAPAKSNENAQT